MIDYVIILLAVVCFAGQFAFTKLYERVIRQTFVTSLIMLSATGVVGTVLYLIVGGFKVNFSPISLILAIALALVMVPYYMVGIKVLSLGSLAIFSMFMMLGGMLVPFFYGIIFLDEPSSFWQILGAVLLTLFIILQAVWQESPNDGNASSSKSTKYLFFALCLVIFFLNGATSVISKAHQISAGAVDEVSFTVIYCFLTAVFGMILLPFGFIKNKSEAKSEALETFKVKPVVTMFLIGAAAHTGNFLLLKAASNVPASVQYPLVSGGVIVLSALTSAFIFKEKLSLKEWLSVVGVFASTFLFAF